MVKLHHIRIINTDLISKHLSSRIVKKQGTIKTKILLAITTVLLATTVCSQQKDENPRIYQTWVKMEGGKMPYGSLYQLKDSSILLSNATRHIDYQLYNYRTTEFMVENIYNIKVRRKGSKLKGLIIGSISGLCVGYLIGSAKGETSFLFSKIPARNTKILSVVVFTAAGTGLGVLLGSAKITIPINRNKFIYKRNLKKLKKYSICK